MMIVLVAILVALPFRVPVPEYAPAAMDALKRVSEVLELTSPGTQCWGNNFKFELSWVRQGYRVTQELPPASEVARLPPYSCCVRCIDFCRAESDYLNRLAATHLHWEEQLRPRIRAMDNALEFWIAAANVRCNSGIMLTSRARVLDCMKLLGTDAWENRQFPYPWLLHD